MMHLLLLMYEVGSPQSSPPSLPSVFHLLSLGEQRRGGELLITTLAESISAAAAAAIFRLFS